MEANTIVIICLAVSAVINFLLFRLALWQSRDLSVVSENVGDLVEIVNSYSTHLREVYQLDAFYGDPTLEGLMNHTNAVRSLLEEQYGDIINITDPIEYEINEEENAEEESTEKEKHVLYAGSRRRDS